jgi:hypothetical protein
VVYKNWRYSKKTWKIILEATDVDYIIPELDRLDWGKSRKLCHNSRHIFRVSSRRLIACEVLTTVQQCRALLTTLLSLLRIAFITCLPRCCLLMKIPHATHVVAFSCGPRPSLSPTSVPFRVSLTPILHSVFYCRPNIVSSTACLLGISLVFPPINLGRITQRREIDCFVVGTSSLVSCMLYLYFIGVP